MAYALLWWSASSLHYLLKWMKTAQICNVKCFIYKMDETIAQNWKVCPNFRLYTHIFKHTPSKKWTRAQIIHSSSQPAALTWLVPQQLLLLLLGVPLELPLLSPMSSSSTSCRSSITSRLSQISPICLFMWAMVLCILLIFLCRAVAMALWFLCLASYSCLSCL